MSVSPDDVRRVAALAHLHIEEHELGRLTEDLNQILTHAEFLQEIGGRSGTEPETSVRGPGTSERESIPDPLSRPPSALAPDWREGFFVVPPPPGVHPTGEDS